MIESLTPPPVQYARSGDVQIAFQVFGSGPDMVWAPGSASHLDLDWEGGPLKPLMLRLAAFSRVLKFDKRGTGLSDRPGGVATLEERIDDIRAVMDAAGSTTAHIFGISEGGSMAMLFAATYPDRTRSLILYGTKPRWVRAPDYPWGPSFAEQERSLDARAAGPVTPPDFESEWFRRWVGSSLRDDPGFRAWYVRNGRASLSPAGSIALARWNGRIDVRDILPTIRVPTLIMSKVGDPVIEIDAARDLAARIPGARLVEYPGEGHLCHEISDQMADEMQRFITAEGRDSGDNRVLTTILFMDIVKSTERVTSLGDPAWAAALRQFYAVVRRELANHHGTEVDRAGDGFLATFDGPARAIRCARAIQLGAQKLDLAVRAGVHTGEVERNGTAISGLAVHVAARIAGEAGSGEVLVSGTVSDLTAGAGIVFEDRGTRTLKGVSDPKRVLAATAG